MPSLRVHALLYGDHPDLHERLLSGFRRALPPGVPVRLWANQPGDESRRLLEDAPSDWTVTCSDENVPKYVAMGRMFPELREDWAVWFDDDSWIESDDWYERTLAALPASTGYLGACFGFHFRPGQWERIREARWFRGREPLVLDGAPGVWFAQGAYWWLRADLLRAIEWPDPRLRHNGGDVMLGEALRQQGVALTPFSHGVRVNDAARRGHSEAPL